MRVRRTLLYYRLLGDKDTMPPLTPQRLISAACEADLVKYGDTFRGVGYTKSDLEAQQRYALMLEVVREKEESVSLLDFGCGLAHMLDHLECRPERRNVQYSGLDISSAYLDAARARHPEADLVLDGHSRIRCGPTRLRLRRAERRVQLPWALDEESMLRYWKQLTSVAYRHCRRGMAFNVMSKIVDWEREDLFHLPFDTMARFVAEALSRHFIIRHDYGAYEYTTYVYRSAGQI